MARHDYIRHKVPEIAEGLTDSIPVNRRRVLAGLLMEIPYTWDMVGGSGAGALRSDPSAQILREFTFRANGEVQQFLTGEFLREYEHFFAAGPLAQIPPTSVATDAQELNRRARLRVPFDMGWSFTPATFGVPTRSPMLDDPLWTFKWASGADLVIGHDGAPKITYGTPLFKEEYYLNPRVPAGGFSPLRVQRVQTPIVSAGRLEIDLEPLEDGMELRGVLMITKGGASVAVLDKVDTILSEVSLETNTTVREEIDASLLQVLNAQTYGLAATRTGVYLLDSADDKVTTRGDLWTVGNATPKLVCDVLTPEAVNRIDTYVIYTRR